MTPVPYSLATVEDDFFAKIAMSKVPDHVSKKVTNATIEGNAGHL